MRALITEKHLVAGKARVTIFDTKDQGFVLRTTPNGKFTFYHVFKNPKKVHPTTGKPKLDWYCIGDKLPVDKARKESRRLADDIDSGIDVFAVRRKQELVGRRSGITFGQLHDEYIDDCQVPVKRRYGTVPRLESWRETQCALRRPYAKWRNLPADAITDDDVIALLKTWIDDGHVPMANRVRTLLHTLFEWARMSPRKYVPVNPVAVVAKEENDTGDGRVLDREEIVAFWHGTDNKDCPVDRLTVLALKLSLVTMLRSGECVQLERLNIAPATADSPATMRIPLAGIKSRRSKKADVIQPLNSLAQEILAEALSIGDPNRRYVFPGAGKRRHTFVQQPTLAHALNRTAKSKKGRNGKRDGRMGICQYLGIDHFSPHALRRTGGTICEELGFDEATIGKVMTHKPVGKDASPVTRKHYLNSKMKPIIARPVVDGRIKVLDALDEALREILDLPRHSNRRAA